MQNDRISVRLDDETQRRLRAEVRATGKNESDLVREALTDYFRRRPEQARRDASYGLSITLDYCTTLDLQRQAVHALAFKCDVLWALLDAVAHGSAAGGSDHE